MNSVTVIVNLALKRCNFSRKLLLSGLLGISIITAIPTHAQTETPSNKSIIATNSSKNIQADLEFLERKNMLLIAETEVAEAEVEVESAHSSELVTDKSSTRRPLSCRIFPTTSMQH